MGLWDWIFHAIIERDGDRAAGRRSGPPAETAGGSTALATAEPPRPGHQAPAKPSEAPWWAPQGETRTEPPPVQRPALSNEGRALENTLVSQLDGHDLVLPPMPQVAERVLQQLQRADCDFGRVAKVIGEDQVIAAAVVRLANSPLYRGVDKITALRPAISRLGVKALRTLMLNQAMRTTLAGDGAGDRALAALLWQRALAGGAVMRGLSAFTEVDQEEAFLIGLLHDIGNVIVLREVSRQHHHVDYQFDVETFDYLCDECHQEFGELIAGAWSLPPTLQSLIGDHHRYPEADDPLRTERLMVLLSDMICAQLGYGRPVSYDLLATRPVQDLNLAYRANFLNFLFHLPGQVEDLAACL